MSDLPRSVVCVLNPARRKSHAARQALERQCSALGLAPPRFLETTIEQPGGVQAREALDAGADLVIVAGGDGTVRNVAKELAGTRIPLGIMPIGTANIFHLNAIGKRRSLDQSARNALLGGDVPVDIGGVKLIVAGSDEPVHERFLVVVGVGRDAMTIQGVSESLKRRIGPLAYFAAGARHVLRPGISMQIEVDGEIVDHADAWSVLVGNCGVVPGGITVLPQASLTDGYLDYLHVAPRHIGQWIPIGVAGLTGHRRSPAATTSKKVQNVTIIPSRPVPIQIDGDVVENVIQAEVTIIPERLVIRGGAPG